MTEKLIVGTRGSPLALAQTNEIVEALRKIDSKFRFEIMPIRTEGDKSDSWQKTAQRKDLFTKEIEEFLLNGKIDIAVHSMKDLTINIARGLAIVVPKRLDPRDALVAREHRTFSEIPAGARVGTSSIRRKAQLLASRSDLTLEDLHGNVNTRLRKLASGEFEAIVLAAAGLMRLGLTKQISEVLPTDIMLPAVGQGALAIQCREDTEDIKELTAKIEHQPTRQAVLAERAFARRLGGDCQTPIAAYARHETSGFVIEGMVGTPNGKMILRSRLISQSEDSEKVGEELAARLLKQGAEAILEAS